MQGKIIDGFGGFASAACVAHCLIISLAPSVLTTLEFGHSFQEVFEWSFYGLAVVFALISGSFGFKAFKKLWLFSSFGLGIIILSIGRMSEALSLFEGGDILSVLGGITIFIAHLFSLRCC
jgi:hypothetical protein